MFASRITAEVVEAARVAEREADAADERARELEAAWAAAISDDAICQTEMIELTRLIRGTRGRTARAAVAVEAVGDLAGQADEGARIAMTAIRRPGSRRVAAVVKTWSEEGPEAA